MTDQETLGVAAVAARLGVKRSAVRKAIKRGTIAATMVDGAWRVDADEVDRYAREHRTPRVADR